MTTLPGEGSLLRIFIGESDRHAGMLLYEWIVRTAKILELSTDLPIIVEIVDRAEKIEAFLPVIDGAIADGLATVERVQIKFYRSGPA